MTERNERRVKPAGNSEEEQNPQGMCAHMVHILASLTQIQYWGFNQ